MPHPKQRHQLFHWPGRMIGSFSTIVTVLFVLLMGKGFNITRGRLKQSTAVRLTIFMCGYVVTYACIFLYEQMVRKCYLKLNKYLH